MRVAVATAQPTEQHLKASLVPQQQQTHERKRRCAALLQLLNLVYSWLLWGFFTALLFGQALGIAWTHFTASTHIYFGQDPSLGVYQVLGTNDVPFTDRSFVCSLQGRVYRPVQLQEALESPSTFVADTSGGAINGYRMLRRTGLTMSDFAMTGYKNTCELIAATMDAVLDRCVELGYNVTRDSLRIVDDTDSTTMKLIPDTLPVIVIPFSDNSFYSRYAIPGWDGSACLFRLNGAYETQGYPDMTFRGINRTVREQKTVELLEYPGGVWRNGWYEDLEGTKWYSEFMSTGNTSLGITMREFDMAKNTERDCLGASGVCGKTIQRNWWGPRLSVSDNLLPYTTVAILNERHYGVFQYDAMLERSVESVYDLQMILANVSLGALLFRWLVAKIVMLNSNRSGDAELQSVGIGVLSCARGFHWLPILLLPRLKTNLAVFATIGGFYEGAQIALAEAWFLMYPGIAELLFFVYSLLNLVAKLLHRRMSDVFFGPMLIFFCVMHYVRINLGQSGWFEYDGRIPTVLTSKQFDQLSLLDFFKDDTLLKLNGNVKSLFLIKIGVLSLNLLPLLFSRSTTRGNFAKPTATEDSLGFRLASSGGIGSSTTTPGTADLSSTKTSHRERTPGYTPTLSGFELLRLGYLVLDDTWLMFIHDWYLLVLMAPLQKWFAPSIRVMVFAVHQEGDASGCVNSTDKKPLLCRTSDPRIANCHPWRISTRSFQ